MTFNGIDFADMFSEGDDIDKVNAGYFLVNEVTGRELFGASLKTVNVDHMDGAYPSYMKVDPRIIEVRFTLKGTSFEDLRTRVDVLNKTLFTNGNDVEITFDDEPNRYYYGQFSGYSHDLEHSQILKGVIEITCTDPFKYGEEVELIKGVINSIEIDNDSHVGVSPVIELEARSKSTMALVADGGDEESDYNLVGFPTEVDEEVVDTRQLLFEERGQSLDKWSVSGVGVDGGVVSGEMNTDNVAITVPSYGSGDAWHGPALVREITPIQDFEVEMMLSGATRTSNQTFRIEMYLYDESMNNLGKMSIWDNDKDGNEKKGEARYGEYGGRFVNYAISSRNYKYRVTQYFGLLRFTRRDDKMTFYITRINTRNKHVKSIKESVVIDEELMGKLRYVQIHIGKYAGTSNANAPRILYIKASEIFEERVDETPYVIYKDDIVTFDHVTEEILINGEPRNELKDFGGKFFNLPPGKSTLQILPADTFDVEVRYRNKYL